MEQNGAYLTTGLKNSMILFIIFISHWYLFLFVQTFFLHRYASHQMFKMHPITEGVFYFNRLLKALHFYIPVAYAPA